jgi:3'-phosphoadenosine 5'-phosphosulfate sulfotransferase (PAPS reductase)/FAD synthetase
LNPDQILADTQKGIRRNLALAFSGAEDVVLIDMASKNGHLSECFSLDTGRLHPETYVYLDTVRNHYKIDIEIFTPDAMLLQNFVSAKGLNSFYRDGHRECCGIRKVEPLKRALEGRLAWVTGLRRDQSPATRSDLVHAELDQLHRNADGEPLIKSIRFSTGPAGMSGTISAPTTFLTIPSTIRGIGHRLSAVYQAVQTR